jgi:ATP phosphoribosyltransferase regulatory subunit
LRGYHYHTGLVFSAYTPQSASELAKGGRYDHIGEAFGRARPATGFSADLKSLVNFYEDDSGMVKIFAPAHDDGALAVLVAQLRAEGRIVIQALTGDRSTMADFGCQQQLVLDQHGWQIVQI